jgi:hypothetical protein
VVAVTLGAAGSLWSIGGEVVAVPAPLGRGAGHDRLRRRFHGAYALGLAEGLPPLAAARFASAAAALKAANGRGWDGMPDRASLDRMVAEAPPGEPGSGEPRQDDRRIAPSRAHGLVPRTGRPRRSVSGNDGNRAGEADGDFGISAPGRSGDLGPAGEPIAAHVHPRRGAYPPSEPLPDRPGRAQVWSSSKNRGERGSSVASGLGSMTGRSCAGLAGRPTLA